MKDNFFKELKEKIQSNFEEGGSHAFDHTERVYNLGIKIGKEEKADLEIIKVAALLHDIEVHRHSKGLIAKSKEAKIIQDADRLDALGAITIGRMFSTGGKINRPLYNPEIPFGKIYKGYYSDSTIHGFYAKILKITPNTFNTKSAKKLAKGRYKFVEKFLDQFFKEWKCEL